MGRLVLGERVRLYGREPERAAIDELLDGARQSRGAALVLHAEPGIGKSALLGYALARSDGMRVLRAVGVEPEIGLPFAALHQLLRPVFGSIDRIPPVQASMLRGALGIGPGGMENRFVISLAVLSLLAEVAADGPVLCLVDDAHWLDQPSADALAFVARRLEGERVGMLFAARSGDVRSFPAPGLPRREVPGLAPAEAEQLLTEHFGPSIAPETRRMICRAARGNPLALLEIPEELTADQLAGREPLPRPMPMGHDLEEVFDERVRRLAAPTRLLLLVAAAEGSGDPDVVLAAGRRLGIPPEALVEAESSGLIRTEDGVLAFRHPVLRSAVYRTASLSRRQLVHGALVEVLQEEADADRRAWHRAALLLHPDDDIADELERTASRARNRSGHAAAYAALRRAAELTTSDRLRARRLVAAARAAWDAGLAEEAITLLPLVEDGQDADTFAELRHVRGEIALGRGNPREGAVLLMEGAGRAVGTDPGKALQMLLDAAMCANCAGDLRLMLAASRQAGDLPIRPSDPEAPFVDLLTGLVAMLEGPEADLRVRLPRILDRVAGSTDPRWLVWAGAVAVGLGDQARHDALCQRAEAAARRSTAVATLPTVLERIAWTTMMYGRVGAAGVHAEEGMQLALETDLTNSACFHRAVLAWVAAVRGDSGACTSLAAQASEVALRQGLRPHSSLACWAVGLLHLGAGNWDQAATVLEGLLSPTSETGHPFVARRALPDVVEAAVRAHRVDLARSAATQFEHFAHAPDWERSLEARCRALVARSPEARERLYVEALALDDRDRRPFGRARTLLLLGEHLRRERRRAEARPHLRDAVEIFGRLGAAPWEKRARAELRATGETARRREPATLSELTPQQIQIAGLVAEGATNKEVAAHLFLSPRTVDYHLRKVFIKLDISSRAELIRLQLADS